MGRDDRLYVISRSKEETTRGIRVTICDAESGYFGNFGGYGPEGGKFVWPACGAVDSQGRYFISDEKQNRITTYDADGHYLFHWGQAGSSDGELDTPRAWPLTATTTSTFPTPTTTGCRSSPTMAATC